MSDNRKLSTHTRTYELDALDPAALRLKQSSVQAMDQVSPTPGLQVSREANRFPIELVHRLIDAIKQL